MKYLSLCSPKRVYQAVVSTYLKTKVILYPIWYLCKYVCSFPKAEEDKFFHYVFLKGKELFLGVGGGGVGNRNLWAVYNFWIQRTDNFKLCNV